MALLDSLIAVGVAGAQLGVVSPYKAQVTQRWFSLRAVGMAGWLANGGDMIVVQGRHN
jgi:hypothetical protein